MIVQILFGVHLATEPETAKLLRVSLDTLSQRRRRREKIKPGQLDWTRELVGSVVAFSEPRVGLVAICLPHKPRHRVRYLVCPLSWFRDPQDPQQRRNP